MEQYKAKIEFLDKQERESFRNKGYKSPHQISIYNSENEIVYSVIIDMAYIDKKTIIDFYKHNIFQLRTPMHNGERLIIYRDSDLNNICFYTENTLFFLKDNNNFGDLLSQMLDLKKT